MSSNNQQTFTAMFAGFAKSLERFHAATKNRNQIDTSASLFELLNWAVTLDERVCTDWTPKGKPLGWAWREHVIGAEILQGVRFARNRVHHQWSDALEFDDAGRRYPKTFPVVYFEWRWRPAAHLPQPANPRYADPDGQRVYEEQLEHEIARETAQQLANVFNHLRKRMEPPVRPGLSTAQKLLAVQPTASAGLPTKSLG